MGSSVLITNGGKRQVLATIRSLGRKNITTVVGEAWPRTLSFYSRYCGRSIIYPPPLTSPDDFVRAIVNYVRRTAIDVIFPVSDWSTLLISKHRELIEPYSKLPLPSHEKVEGVLDKSSTLKAAAEEGIPVPKTYHISDTGQLRQVSQDITYPIVIKPKTSFVWDPRVARGIYRRASFVTSPSKFLSTYMAVHEAFPLPMVQEYVPGINFSIAVLTDHGEPKAACGIRVTRANPVAGGNSVLCESVPLDPEMKRLAFLLLKRLRWHGIAEVEFRVDPRNSVPKLMEVNGRFWGTLEVAIRSGVDFPYLLYRLAMGERVKPLFSYKAGVKLRWLTGDMMNLRSILKDDHNAVRAQLPSKLQALSNFLRCFKRDMHYDIFSLDDPLPFLVMESPYFLLRRLMKPSSDIERQ